MNRRKTAETTPRMQALSVARGPADAAPRRIAAPGVSAVTERKLHAGLRRGGACGSLQPSAQAAIPRDRWP